MPWIISVGAYELSPEGRSGNWKGWKEQRETGERELLRRHDENVL